MLKGAQGPCRRQREEGGSKAEEGRGVSMLNHPLQDNLIPAATLRNLSDRVYEKRKAAALEIENLVKERMESPLGGRQDIERILTVLGNDYALSSQANLRKGGLIGIAAAALGLGADAWR